MIRCAVLTLLLSSLPVCALGQSAAGPEGRHVAEELTKSGLSAFEHHDYATALALLQRASVLAPGPALSLYSARACAALGRLVEAAQDYRSVVDGAAGSETAGLRRVLEAGRDELAQLRPRIPAVDVSIGQTALRARNLRVLMDGREIIPGTALAVDPGRHEVVGSDADGERAHSSFEIDEGESKTIALSWRPDLARTNKELFAGTGASSARRNWGVVALGVGATGLGVGTVTGIAALSRYSAAEQHCPAGRCVEGAPYPEDGSAFRTLRTISAAGYVVGAGGIGTWLGLLLSTPKPATEHPSVSAWTPVVGMGSAGARYAF